MLPSQLPAIDTFFLIGVCLGVDVKRNRIVAANHPRDDLILHINTRLISEVCKDVVTDLRVTRIRTILCLKRCCCFLVEWAKTWTRELIIEDYVFERSATNPVSNFLIEVACGDVAGIAVVVLDRQIEVIGFIWKQTWVTNRSDSLAGNTLINPSNGGQIQGSNQRTISCSCNGLTCRGAQNYVVC